MLGSIICDFIYLWYFQYLCVVPHLTASHPSSSVCQSNGPSSYPHNNTLHTISSQVSPKVYIDIIGGKQLPLLIEYCFCLVYVTRYFSWNFYIINIYYRGNVFVDTFQHRFLWGCWLHRRILVFCFVYTYVRCVKSEFHLFCWVSARIAVSSKTRHMITSPLILISMVCGILSFILSNYVTAIFIQFP